MKKNILLVLCFLALVSLLKAQSFFAEGEWIKLGVTEGGFCKLTKSQLTSYGLTEVDSKKLKVYGGDGRDLIQKNADTRYLEPQLVPHLIIDTGKYSTDFALVFLAESPSSISLDPSRILRTNLNTYSDTVYYYITKSQEIASQINTLNSTGNHVKNENVIIHGHYEKDDINLDYDFYDDED